MSTMPAGHDVQLYDLGPAVTDFKAEVLAGLACAPRRLACKFFYDERGSRLFDRICELDEYYPTRTELSIMRRHAPQMAGLLGPECLLIEFGSGSSLKTRLLLDHLRQPAGYVPVDISRGHLLRAARALAAAYPDVRIMPVCADYTYPLRLPPAAVGVERKIVYFPGSTIGNFAPEEARVFLLRARELTGAAGGLLIGVDLKKDPRILHAAYNDSAGVTAEFNLNLLARINRELAGDFDLERFAHYAFYHPSSGRIEMHLVSLADQMVRVAGETFSFNRGESIFTESSWKYTVEEFRRLAAQAGYRLQQVWTDEERLFSVQFFVSS